MQIAGRRLSIALALAALLVAGAALSQPGAQKTPHGGALRGAPPVPGATRYVNALLNPARPLSDGARVELWMAKTVRPTVDGVLERADWAGAMELSLAFATETEGARGYPPRAAVCLAVGEKGDRLLLAMACEDDTLEPLVLPAPGQPPGAAPAEGAVADPWAHCDVLAIELGPTNDEGRPSRSVIVARSGEVLAEGGDPLGFAVHDFEGVGWSAELVLPLSGGDAELPLRVAIVNASGSVAPWPLCPPDAKERPVGTLALKKPGAVAQG